MRRFRTSDPDFAEAFEAFINERRDTPADVDASVRDVLAAVRRDGIEALIRFGRDFDKVELTAETLRVTQDEIDAGVAACPVEVREAIAFAAKRIRAYHERQRPADAAFTAGFCGYRRRAPNGRIRRALAVLCAGRT
jgi:histidinol dehydrogenase